MSSSDSWDSAFWQSFAPASLQAEASVDSGESPPNFSRSARSSPVGVTPQEHTLDMTAAPILTAPDFTAPDFTAPNHSAVPNPARRALGPEVTLR